MSVSLTCLCNSFLKIMNYYLGKLWCSAHKGGELDSGIDDIQFPSPHHSRVQWGRDYSMHDILVSLLCYPSLHLQHSCHEFSLFSKGRKLIRLIIWFTQVHNSLMGSVTSHKGNVLWFLCPLELCFSSAGSKNLYFEVGKWYLDFHSIIFYVLPFRSEWDQGEHGWWRRMQMFWGFWP